jgi:hypothetical protein
MTTEPTTPNDVASSPEWTKNDIPAETDDLQLGKRPADGADPINNPGSDPDSQARRTGGSPDDPHGGRE